MLLSARYLGFLICKVEIVIVSISLMKDCVNLCNVEYCMVHTKYYVNVVIITDAIYLIPLISKATILYISIHIHIHTFMFSERKANLKTLRSRQVGWDV